MKAPQPVVIGKIYANWCRHCERMGTGFKDNIDAVMKGGGSAGSPQIVEIEESDGKDAKIAKLNSEYFGGAPKVVANWYPTVFAISGGKVDYYNGPTDFTNPNSGKHNSAVFQKWVKKHIRSGRTQRGGGCGCGGFSQRGGWMWRKSATKKSKTAAKTPSKKQKRSTRRKSATIIF